MFLTLGKHGLQTSPARDDIAAKKVVGRGWDLMTEGATQGRFHRLLPAGACGVATSNSSNMR